MKLSNAQITRIVEAMELGYDFHDVKNWEPYRSEIEAMVDIILKIVGAEIISGI